MQYTSSNKKMVQILVQECLNYGIKHAVISPGSRNAPLIIAFDNHPLIECYSIPDERSAAFYALGMSRQLNEPVAIICTSGTAVLNYAPALTEAYYQEVPLIAITADRPPYLIDQEDGQTIRQNNVFANHIRYSINLPLNEDYETLKNGSTDIKQALNTAISFTKGPVHINIPFEEPLYDNELIDIKRITKNLSSHNIQVSNDQVQRFLKAWDKSEKIMFLVGVQTPNQELESLLANLANEKNAVIFAPATSNTSGKNTFNTVESLFYSVLVQNNKKLQPDLLITLGGPIVSKAAKQYLKEYKPAFHFDIDKNPAEINTYKALTEKITCDPILFINSIAKETAYKPKAYIDSWNKRNLQISNCIAPILDEAEWSDISIYRDFFANIPFDIDLHLANSTPVRYTELFTSHPKVNYYCNRGTSGIDGSTSTAAGAALISGKPTVLLTGDISFFYDSNAFWNKHVPDNLKIVLINNGGGNIFKVIRGPENTNQLESLFVTKQNAKTEKLCQAFEVNYLSCGKEQKLGEALSNLYKSEKCTVLEIFTPADESAENYRGFFKAIKAATI